MDDCTLLHGDCLDILPTLEAGSVDAIVTDPPYGIGFNYDGNRESTDSPEAYWRWLQPIYQGALRCLRPGGLMVMWQAQLNFPHFWEWFGLDIHIYAACKNFVQINKTPINYGYDPVVMFYKPGAAPLQAESMRRNIDFFVANTANMSTREHCHGHPCPRPLDQVREIVFNFTVEGGTVLDPFMGSGTTGLACLYTGRRFIGIEIDEHYFQVAQKRIALAQDEGPLFAPCQGTLIEDE